MRTELIRERGSEFLHEAGQTLRSHPIPVLLSVAGLACVAAASSSSTMRERATRYSTTLREKQAAGASALRRTSQRISSSTHSLARRGGRMTSGFSDVVRERPLAVGALALVAGALCGLAAPMVAAESRMLRDSFGGDYQRRRASRSANSPDGGAESAAARTAQSSSAQPSASL